MRYFLEFVLASLVEHPEEVDVEESVQNKNLTFRVRVNPDDVGRVIGRHGKTIGSIRSLLNAAASKTKKRVILQLVEEQTVNAV